MKNSSRKLKIAMLGHKHVPSREGGIEIVVEELSKRLVNRGNSVVCYNRQGHHISGKEFNIKRLKEYNGIQLKSVFTIKHKGLAAVSSSIIATCCVAFGDFEIVHFHAEGPCVMLWLPKLLGKRCIVTIHGIDWRREKWHGGFGAKYIHYCEKVAVKYADDIIVLSKDIQKYFKDTYGRETYVIPNGVNRPMIRKAELITRNWQLKKDEYILYLGRIVPEKGLRYLIKAFKSVITDKRLMIVGGTSDTDCFFQELKALAMGDNRITFTGFIQGQELNELFSNAYIYVLPSDLEGMPLSLLEAMSYGNCCLVSNIAECTEIVEDKAVIFNKGDVDDLKRKLQKLCDDEELVQTYKKGITDFICEKYSWEEVTDQTLELYKKNKSVLDRRLLKKR